MPADSKRNPIMEFRWLSVIALWTLLSGPIFGPPARSTIRSDERARTVAVKSSLVYNAATRR
jgi:hypothetical protein